jgi:O-antigen/teichoic acid export membrane protein
MTGDRALALADQGTVSALNLITTIVIGRACEKGELGLYTVGFTIVALSFTIQKALIVTPYTILAPQLKGAARRRYRGNTLIQNVGLAIVLVAVLIFAALVVARLSQNSELLPVMLTLGVVGIPVLMREYARQVSIAELRIQKALILDLATAFLQLAGILLAAVCGLLSARLAFMFLGTASGVAALGWFAASWRSMELKAEDFRGHIIQNWFFGRWLFASGVLAQLSVSVYPWLILMYHGAAEAGVWAACVGAVAIYNPVMLALYNESAPRIAHEFASGGLASLRQSVTRTTAACALATLPFLAILVVFGNKIVVLMYGTKYQGAGTIVTLLAAATFFFALGFGYPPGLLALKRPGLDFTGNAMSFLVLVVFGWWLAYEYGAVGGAAGVLMARAAAVGSKASVFEFAIRRTPR